MALNFDTIMLISTDILKKKSIARKLQTLCYIFYFTQAIYKMIKI